MLPVVAVATIAVAVVMSWDSASPVAAVGETVSPIVATATTPVVVALPVVSIMSSSGWNPVFFTATTAFPCFNLVLIASITCSLPFPRFSDRPGTSCASINRRSLSTAFTSFACHSIRVATSGAGSCGIVDGGYARAVNDGGSYHWCCCFCSCSSCSLLSHSVRLVFPSRLMLLILLQPLLLAVVAQGVPRFTFVHNELIL